MPVTTSPRGPTASLTAARTDANVMTDITVTANFVINSYTLTYMAGENGTVTGASPQTVDHGGSGTQVTAVPNVGYHFVSWSDGVLTASRTDSNVTADIGVTATFSITTFTLTYTAGANGTITGISPQTIVHGGSGTEVTAVPNAGYHFVSWSDGVLTASRTDTNVTADITVTASFAITSYTLTYTAGANGTITGISPQTVAHGGNGSLVTAVPNTGYHFVSWSDGVLTAARTGYQRHGGHQRDRQLCDQHLHPDLHGRAPTARSRGPRRRRSTTARSGTPVTAVPNVGYHFVSWCDGVLTAARTDTNVTANITRHGELRDQHLHPDLHGRRERHDHGHVAADGRARRLGHASHGGSEHRLPLRLWSDGVLTAARTDTNVTANITVTATFAINTYTLTYTAGANGTITGRRRRRSTTAPNGTVVTAVPNAGYHFVSWTRRRPDGRRGPIRTSRRTSR